MAVVCQSRFAVLKVEGEEPEEQQKQVKTSKPAAKATVKGAESKAKPKKKKRPTDKDAAVKPKPKAEVPSEGSENWESWKKRDDQFVTYTYEQDLQEALRLSRLEYEENGQLYTPQQKDAPPVKLVAGASSESKPKKKKKNKEKKTATMTLEEFNHRDDAGTEETTDVTEEDAEVPVTRSMQETRKVPVEREDFFDRVLKDAESIIMKEQKADEQRKKQPFCLEQVRQIQYQEELEKKDLEIARLSSEVERLTKELKVVKVRNKQLCVILGHGEMKDKAEILKNYEELSQVKDELTQEVMELHAALEQERSKVHSLQTELKKPGKKENR
ncbi:G kinase-anchoring protein 1-like [Ornithodoros turicata]|uniref:G kinase-anchoring protein 1-like n=1 Tax=Ornithodoros turicata TaxID=34597 RepID=UPI00313A2C02